MSAFSPLNLVEDVSASKKDLEEEHTRELEIENAYKTYSDAISLQSQGRWTAAYKKYKELANSAVVVNHFYEEISFVKGFQNGGSNLQPDELSFVPQNVKKIRFLFFRNRGFLHFNILKAGPAVLDEILQTEAQNEPGLTVLELQKDLFYTMLDGFVNCLLYDEADESLLRILYDIYTFLDVRRLAKLTLEYCVSYAYENDENTSISCLNDWSEPLWTKFKTSGFATETDKDELTEKLSFLVPLRDDFIVQMEDKMRLHSLNVSLKNGASWLEVVHSINSAIRENQDKERVQDFQKIACKYFDPYRATESTLDDISFEFMDVESGKEPVIELPPVSVAEISEGEDEKEPLPAPVLDTPEIAAQAEKSMRASKRLNPGDSAPVDADDILLIRRYFIETELFFNNLNESFRSIFNAGEPVLHDMVGHIVNTEPVGSEPEYVYDFLKVLNEWKPSKYDAILRPEKDTNSKRKSQSDKKRLIEVLTSFGNQLSDSKKEFQNLYDTQDGAFVKAYISEQFSSHCHVNDAKLKILSHLMASITTTTWDDQLYDCVSDWVMQLEPQCYDINERALHGSGHIQDISLVLGIYEVLINAYIVTKERVEQYLEGNAHTSFVKSVKTNYNTTAIELLRLKDRIDKWAGFIKNYLSVNADRLETNLQFVVRFYWASNYYVAAKSFSWREKKYVVVHLHTLSELLKNAPAANDVQIAYPNYSKIGEFSLDGLQRRLSTASILSIFSKILDQSDSETVSTNETISLLESILFDEDSMDSDISTIPEQESSLVSSVMHGLAVLDKVSLSSVKEFFYECPVDLKLSLWNILFSYYQKDSFLNFQKGLEHYLQFIVDFLNTSYKGFRGEKPVLLLSLVVSYRHHLATFLEYLSQSKWQLPSKSISVGQISNVARMYELCYIFSLHEEAALYTSRKVSLATKSESSFCYFKDFFIDCITILSTYCFNYIAESGLEKKDSWISNFLILVHHQLGLRHLCDSSKGLFLKFAEDSLVMLSKLPETELTQIMSCRYHYKVKLYGQFPVDHYTDKSAELNKQSAEELALFILPLCFRTNPLTQTPRNDLKQVVDDLFEIIGDPDVENDRTLSENMVTVERFIDRSSAGGRFVKEAFHGLKSLEMAPPQYENRVAQRGLYFLEAVLMFNSYKIRKKSAQSRTVELERIISVLIYDLIYGSDRVESWILLAQAYGYIVEDDLIWTSDKINTVEKKVPTANAQRKSLVCYLMAISTITRRQVSDMEALKPVMNVLMNSFAKELYSASRSPMDMLAFHVHSESKFVRQEDKTFFLKVSEKTSVSQRSCLLLMNRCLNMAVKASPEDWNSLYYSAKVKAKLGEDPSEVFGILLRSSAAAKKAGVSGDPILEPVYKFLSLSYKYVRSGKLSVEDGVKYLNMDTTLTRTNEFQAATMEEFAQCILQCLKKIIALDKKAWYHKPAYRQAIITFTELNDAHAAKEILSKFFTLRSNNKTFLQMWKPEHERPGKHFLYMYQYTKFYITLMTHEQDLTSLALMYPKLRRANSTMVSLNVVWEQLCTSICAITRKILDIDSFHVRVFLASVSYSNFIAQAHKVVVATDPDNASGYLQKHLAFLHILTDIRKQNNGFGPTASIDYTFTGIFIQIFREITSQHRDIVLTHVPESPNGKVKKLAKRDLFPFAIDLATKCKRTVEQFLKYNPDIFNTYVAEYEREAEILRQKKAADEQKSLLASQLRFSRLFAEQLLLREQKKSMYKMLGFVMPRGWSSTGSSSGSSTSQPSTVRPDMYGPQALASSFNESRRSVRLEGIMPKRSLPYHTPYQTSSATSYGNDISRMVTFGGSQGQVHPMYGVSSGPYASIANYGPRPDGQVYRYSDARGHPVYYTQPTTTGGSFMSHGHMATFGQTEASSSGTQQSPEWAQPEIPTEIRGTEEDPVEIHSDGLMTPEAEKRTVDAMGNAEESGAKRR